jgi:hypothetical protein
MTYKMLDEVKEHNSKACNMKKAADDAVICLMSSQKKMGVATKKVEIVTETVRTLQDQLAHLQRQLKEKDYRMAEMVESCLEKEHRIIELEEENMDLMDTIHGSVYSDT